jgi:hypothetical protein
MLSATPFLFSTTCLLGLSRSSRKLWVMVSPETPVQHQRKSRGAALPLAPGRSGGALGAREEPWPPAGGAGGFWRVCSRGTGAKGRLKFLHVRSGLMGNPDP